MYITQAKYLNAESHMESFQLRVVQYFMPTCTQYLSQSARNLCDKLIVFWILIAVAK